MPYNLKEFPYPLRVGCDVRSCNDLPAMFNDLDQQIDFIMVDVGHALNFRDENTIQTRDIALSRPGKF
jgi:hypothetical protein